MAYKDFSEFSLDSGTESNSQTLQVDGARVELPDASYVRDAALERDGMDLVLDGPQGTVTVEGYFSAPETPDLVAPDGETLTPELVNSFAKSPMEYAQSATMNDASPVGNIDEVSGEATITRLSGEVETIRLGMDVYEGDVIETSGDGAVNIAFVDDTSFAVSEEARLAIDEYVYDPVTESGTQDFSVLKGVFVFTSGLIGRDDPDDVNIDTPSGSIGIRGTIIAGNADTGEITVVEGAIVVRDFDGNEMTLATQFETAKFGAAGGGIENMGQLPPHEVSQKFSGVSEVSPTLFSSINDAMAEHGDSEGVVDANPSLTDDQPVEMETPVEPQQPQEFDADGAVDQDGDHQVDGTVEEGALPHDGPVDEAMPEEGQLPGDGPVLQGDKPLQQTTTTNTFGMDPMMTNTMTGTMGTMDPAMTQQMHMMEMGMDPTMEDLIMTMDNPVDHDIGDNTGDENVNSTGNDLPQNPETIVPPPQEPGAPPLHIVSAQMSGVPGFGAGERFAADQISVAPNAPGAGPNFFQAAEGQSWGYHFDLEFVNANNFQLSAGTVTQLNFLRDSTGDISSWNFNNSTGALNINFSNTITSDGSFDIDIRAWNGNGHNPAGFVRYDFDYFDADFDLNGMTMTPVSGTGSNKTYADINAPENNTLILGFNGAISNSKFFFGANGGGQDTITVTNNSNNNVINLGNGDNTVTIQSGGNINNIIIGGHEEDSIRLDNLDNVAYGMDGDDIFKLDLDVVGGDLISAPSLFIDGGHSSFRMPFLLEAKPVPSGEDGRGDTLEFLGTGTPTLDFTMINDNYIKGIERIDLTNGIDAQVTLSYTDVLEMTDFHNTLIIRADDDDLTFVGFGGFSKQEDVNLDDGEQGMPDNLDFDVWTDGTVTILIENPDVNATTVTGLP